MNDAKGRGSAAAAEAAVDRALLARVAARDAAAFRTLAGRHLGAVLAHARRMLRDDGEAEDVAQEALLRLWQQASALDVGDLGVRPWLRRVASNLCIDRIRAGRRLDVTDEVPEQEAEPDQLVGLEQKDLAARVDAALRALPERQRIALTLFQYDGLSQIEIGEKLGVSDEAVESLLSRARRTLRKLLNDDWRRLVSET
jgi:RNA polymerase sigma-70 factor (ECF subfamily)